MGEFDDDGFLHITGRKKDIIITSGGKNVAPKNLEAALLKLDLVSSAVCIGEGQRYLTALLTLEPDAAQRFADENGLSVEGLHEQEAVRTTLQAGIEKEVNPEFARVEQIRNFRVLANDFSVETGELTPTFKIKRSVVNEMYAGEIEACYGIGMHFLHRRAVTRGAWYQYHVPLVILPLMIASILAQYA